MPCQDDFPNGYPSADSIANAEVRSAEYRSDKDRLHSATRAACELSSLVQRGGQIEELSADTIAWMTRHAALDIKRLSIEKQNGLQQTLRERGWMKLDQDEREALGLIPSRVK